MPVDPVTQQVSDACEMGDADACGYLMQERQAQSARVMALAANWQTPVLYGAGPVVQQQTQTFCYPSGFGGMMCNSR